MGGFSSKFSYNNDSPKKADIFRITKPTFSNEVRAKTLVRTERGVPIAKIRT